MLSLRVLNPAKDNIDDALIVRHLVFGVQERLLSKPDVDEYDYLPSTRHPVVYKGSQPIATARILFRNATVARARGRHFGFALEELLDLSPFIASGLSVAESGRVAVLRKHRGGLASWILLAGIHEVSLRAGTDVWLAVANAETDSATEVSLMARVARERQLEGPWRVSARVPSSPPANPVATFYEEPAWELANQGELSRLPLPEVLTLFTQRMGARIMGDPLFLSEFSRWSFPIFAMLGGIPASTLDRFDSLAMAHPPA